MPERPTPAPEPGPGDPHPGNPHPDDPHPDDQAPPLGGWGRMYALVLGTLGLLVVLFYLFTLAFD